MAAIALGWLGDPQVASKKVNVDGVADRLTDILFQNAAGVKEAHPVLAHLDLRALTFNSTAGHTFKAALRAVGYEWTAGGQSMWHRTLPGEVLKLQPRAGRQSRCPAKP